MSFLIQKTTIFPNTLPKEIHLCVANVKIKTYTYMYTVLTCILASPVAQMVKNLPAMRETWIWALGREDPLENEMATHCSILPGEFHGERSQASYSLWDWKESDMTEWSTSFFKYSYVIHLCITCVCVCVCVWKSLSRVQLFATPWTIQAMEFSRPEYWCG